MDYAAAVEYLATETSEGIKPDISRIAYLCRLLDHPERAYPVIHITGTNGKTSTARLTRGILTELGFKTALYTSPHLVTYTERYSVDGVDITEEEFAAQCESLIPLVAETNRADLGGKVTQFEFLTALGFKWFADQGVEAAVIEVGMGGRWDATNVARGDVAVITNIELEHTDRLGTTIEAIAGEKAGIIKTGAKVVTAAIQPEALRIIGEQAKQAGARLYEYGRDFEVLSRKRRPEGGYIITAKGLHGTYVDLEITLRGRHQAQNASTAIAAVEAFLLGKRHAATGRLEAAMRTALPQTTSPGRLEVIGREPRVVLDGAHNPAGAARLAEAVGTEFEYDKLILVLGVLADKDAAGITAALVPLADEIIATAPDYYRALPADELAKIVQQSNPRVETEPDVIKALERAKQLAAVGDMVLVAGSLYVVGEVASSLRSSQ